ncbi:sperm surface protein Sp17 [Ornithorhynchus anatinus]|uniref:Sperm surface protein Sp17 n=1 Tax=Ornithorhynchus anatinus TaxID=9258 RepID=Q6SJ92_ORNAN|nr:sperm surface protein Sp17 [Ornithorhynchus anatinus]AAR21214.1 sperm autoantigenic protein 17 [Ornithorhynchus anatinus]
MSIPFSNTQYRIPQGFGNVLEGLTREILKEQPDNIPAFAAAYFEALLEKREKSNFDPAEWGAKADDRFYNNQAFKEAAPGEPEKVKSAVSVKEEAKVTPLEPPQADVNRGENEAATKIQAAFRGHLAREELKKMKAEAEEN